MKYSDELKSRFRDLVKNKAKYIALKKAESKACDVVEAVFDTDYAVSKMIISSKDDNMEEGIIKRTIVGNTYGWMDSHKDVHIPGIFTKSINENKNMFHLHDHEFKINSEVGDPIKTYEQTVPLKALGIDKRGTATALLMDSAIKREYNSKIFNKYLAGKINQHSVGMIYVKMYLCVNDDEFKEEYANWKNYIPYVINEDDALENGYFWAVTEAKLIEISCVLAGSNVLTPTMPVKSLGEPDDSTHLRNPEPGAPTQIDCEKLSKHLKLDS